jgi:hypothetical protein
LGHDAPVAIHSFASAINNSTALNVGRGSHQKYRKQPHAQ